MPTASSWFSVGVVITGAAGAAVSTVRPRATAAPVFPAPSMARTWNVRAPSASVAVVCGEPHVANAALSTRHSNVAPASELNA